MKKQSKKLALNRETLKGLNGGSITVDNYTARPGHINPQATLWETQCMTYGTNCFCTEGNCPTY